MNRIAKRLITLSCESNDSLKTEKQDVATARNGGRNGPLVKREGVAIEKVIAEASPDLSPTLNQIKRLGIERVYRTHLEKLERVHKAALKRVSGIDAQLGRTPLYEAIRRLVEEGRRFEGIGEMLRCISRD